MLNVTFKSLWARKRRLTGTFVAVKAWIVLSKELAFKSARFEQDISRNPLSFHLQELPQPVHSLHYALMHHNVTSRDLDVIACASHKGVELGHRVFALVGKCQVERYP